MLKSNKELGYKCSTCSCYESGITHVHVLCLQKNALYPYEYKNKAMCIIRQPRLLSIVCVSYKEHSNL